MLSPRYNRLNVFSVGNVRRSYRVPNRSKAFEGMYETHILSKKQEGLEVS